MEVETQKPKAMVHDYTSTFKKKLPGQNHRSVIHGVDLGSRGHCVVQTFVRPALDCAIEDSLCPENVRDWRRCWRNKCSRPLLLGTLGGEDFLFEVPVGRYFA